MKKNKDDGKGRYRREEKPHSKTKLRSPALRDSLKSRPIVSDKSLKIPRMIIKKGKQRAYHFRKWETIHLKISASKKDWNKFKWALMREFNIANIILNNIVLPITDKGSNPRIDLQQDQFRRYMKIQAALLGYYKKYERQKNDETFSRKDVKHIVAQINDDYKKMEGFQPFTVNTGKDVQSFYRRYLVEGRALLKNKTIKGRSLLIEILDIQKDLLREQEKKSLLKLYNLTCAAIEHFMPDFFQEKVKLITKIRLQHQHAGNNPQYDFTFSKAYFEYFNNNFFKSFQPVFKNLKK